MKIKIIMGCMFQGSPRKIGEVLTVSRDDARQLIRAQKAIIYDGPDGVDRAGVNGGQGVIKGKK